ncbi:16S rRNA (guanine(966)-N(2))-methyltransferase RsmD [Buchnera aphidicola]
MKINNIKSKKKNSTKIISGYLKGQIINIVQSNKLKPTLHRIRETLFNWVSNKVHNAKCLDCFAGSGSISIEAISRYAKYVVSLEKNYYIIRHLKKNITRLNIKNIHIIHTNTLMWLKKNQYQYDIIFIDPPYHANILQKTIYLINKNNLLKKNGYIYIETYKKNNIQYPPNWTLYKNKNTKNINFSIYLINK